MCGRYVLASLGEVIAEHFRLAALPEDAVGALRAHSGAEGPGIIRGVLRIDR